MLGSVQFRKKRKKRKKSEWFTPISVCIARKTITRVNDRKFPIEFKKITFVTSTLDHGYSYVYEKFKSVKTWKMHVTCANTQKYLKIKYPEIKCSWQYFANFCLTYVYKNMKMYENRRLNLRSTVFFKLFESIGYHFEWLLYENNRRTFDVSTRRSEKWPVRRYEDQYVIRWQRVRLKR